MATATSDAASGGGGGMAAADELPALVRVVAGNPATSAAILCCLNTVDASHLRQLHPAVAGVVAGVPWADMVTPVADTGRWRAAFPAAVGAKVSERPAGGLTPPALAALAGVTHLDLHDCERVTDKVLPNLPPSLRTLNVRSCYALTERASFVHLTALTALDCRGTRVADGGVAGLPPSLQELAISLATLPSGTSLARLTHLRVLRAQLANLDAVTVASLPPSLLELHVAHCRGLPSGTSFAHLSALHTLDVSASAINDASLASMPPSLVSLHACVCRNLTTAAVLPPLPSLRLLDVSVTRVGDALVASLPAGLSELRIAGCRGVTASATLDHVRALQALHSCGTDLAPDVLAACRARGCAVPAAGVLRGHRDKILSLALLADGRLASGDEGGGVRVWDVAAGDSEADMVWNAGRGVLALAALQDGHHLAAAVVEGCVEIWKVGVVPPRRTASVACSDSNVKALAGLADGRLAAGCGNGAIRIIDVDTSTVTATLEGHTGEVSSLAALPNGALASVSRDGTVGVWDVGTRVCVVTLAGHGGTVIRALVVLADGRLASGAGDGTVRLWDVGTRSCVGVLTGHTDCVTALTALPDGRLVSGSEDGTVRMWDTRPAAAAAGSHAVGTVPMVTIAHGLHQYRYGSLLPLPDGRLACTSGDVVHLLYVPPAAVYE